MTTSTLFGDEVLVTPRLLRRLLEPRVAADP
jgi:hypothetical protein